MVAIAEMKKSMTANQIAEAQQQIEAWRASHMRQAVGR